MKLNKKATSIAEAMVLMLIVVTGVTGMYKVYMSSINLEKSTSYKIAAMNIAREGIEAMTNIRNTNWILFSSDINNCWNTFNYNNNALCIGNSGTASDIIEGSYKINKDSINNRWKLAGSINISGYDDLIYRAEHRIGIDSDGFYTQSGNLNNLSPIFTREIKIKYTDIDGNIGDSNDPKMEVTSLVQWVDSSSTKIHKVELVKILSNWKE